MEFRDQSTKYLKDKANFAETSAASLKTLSSKCKEVASLTEEVAEVRRALAEQNVAYQQADGEKNDRIREVSKWRKREESR